MIPHANLVDLALEERVGDGTAAAQVEDVVEERYRVGVAGRGAPANELLAESLKALPPLIEDGLCEVDDTGLRITPKGRYFVRNVAMTLDAYLGEGEGKGKPLFSKTV